MSQSSPVGLVGMPYFLNGSAQGYKGEECQRQELLLGRLLPLPQALSARHGVFWLADAELIFLLPIQF